MISDEYQFLLGCLGRGVSSASTVRELPKSDVLHWGRLNYLSYAHGVMPLLYREIEDRCPSAPPSARRELDLLFRHNAARCLLLSERLLEILATLARRSILAVPFKGPVLAVTSWGGFSYRQFDDLDILVRRCDFRAAHRILIEDGFVAKDHVDGAHAYLATDGSTIVELHWKIGSRGDAYGLCEDALWARLETADLLGETVPTFRPEVLLPVLSQHGAKHGWERLKWVRDLAGLIAPGAPLNWGETFELARESRGVRMLEVGLVLCASLLDSPLPAEAEAASRDPRIQALVAKICARILTPEVTAIGRAERQGLYLGSRESPFDRAICRAHFALDRVTAYGKAAAVRVGRDKHGS